MAQREKELQVPETRTLCVNNCGFYGNPATNNMCQTCFQAAGFASPSSPPPSCSGHEKPRSAPFWSPDPAAEGGRGRLEGPAAKADAGAIRLAPVRQVNRCAGCRKRVGLTGFRCRCGELFCAEHRYSDRHDCSFDYKAVGRDAIARENPLVRAAKLVKI